VSCDPTTNGFQLTENYVLGPGGEELTMIDGQGNWQQTNVRAGGMFLAAYQGSASPTYLHTDHLGTIRASTNSSGGVAETCTNLPFGDLLACNGSGNPSGYHFTGKERDTESGNDYFGARYYASSMGRWLSPDPLYLELHRLTDPQQLNLYSYVRNNPLSLTDPDGHDIAIKCADKANCTTATDQVNARKDGQFKVEIGKDGKWHPVGNVDVSKLSGAEKAFYNALGDTNTHATLTAVSGDGGVFFGLSTGKGSNTVDVADTAQLASAGLSPGSAVAHEAMEAYATAGGASLSDAHNNDPFPGFTLLGAGGIPQVNNGNLTGYQYNLRYNGPGGGNYQVNTTLKTPIPVASFTNPQTRPAAVQQRNTSEMVTGVTPK
jgi:RHS repeat-associated protein